jgi:uncharacterized Fe-S cluster protein YjdI
MSGDARITPTENGPNHVSGGLPVRGHDGTDLAEEREPLMLCRCGGSSNKPFCDGTHRTNGFDRTEVADRGTTAARRTVFRGPGLTIFDDRSICAHIGNCTDNLAQVFKLGGEPWVDPNAATAETIARVIDGCPSGALSYLLDAGAPGDGIGHEPKRPPQVRPLRNGPNAVTGGRSHRFARWAKLRTSRALRHLPVWRLDEQAVLLGRPLDQRVHSRRRVIAERAGGQLDPDHCDTDQDIGLTSLSTSGVHARNTQLSTRRTKKAPATRQEPFVTR